MRHKLQPVSGCVERAMKVHKVHLGGKEQNEDSRWPRNAARVSHLRARREGNPRGRMHSMMEGGCSSAKTGGGDHAPRGASSGGEVAPRWSRSIGAAELAAPPPRPPRAPRSACTPAGPSWESEPLAPLWAAGVGIGEAVRAVGAVGSPPPPSAGSSGASEPRRWRRRGRPSTRPWPASGATSVLGRMRGSPARAARETHAEPRSVGAATGRAGQARAAGGRPRAARPPSPAS